jgi:hypothetical protein
MKFVWQTTLSELGLSEDQLPVRTRNHIKNFHKLIDAKGSYTQQLASSDLSDRKRDQLEEKLSEVDSAIEGLGEELVKAIKRYDKNKDSYNKNSENLRNRRATSAAPEETPPAPVETPVETPAPAAPEETPPAPSEAPVEPVEVPEVVTVVSEEPVVTPEETPAAPEETPPSTVPAKKDNSVTSTVFGVLILALSLGTVWYFGRNKE